MSSRLEATWRRALDRSVSSVGVALAALVLLVALLLPGPLRAIVSLPILLLAPGFALQLAAGRRMRTADPWLTVALSVLLGLALLPLLVLVVYAVHRPLGATEIVAVVVVAMLLLAGIGMWTNGDAANADAARAAGGFSARSLTSAGVVLVTLGGKGLEAWMNSDEGPVAPENRPWRRPRLPLRAIALALVLALTGGVIAVTWAVLPGSTPARYSAIALAGAWSNVHQVTVADPGTRLTVDVRVENHTASTGRYRVVPKLRGAAWTKPTVTLAPGASWQGTITGRMPAGACLHRLSIALTCSTACTQSLVVWLAPRATLPRSCSTIAAGA
jgi:hypothetical protein